MQVLKSLKFDFQMPWMEASASSVNADSEEEALVLQEENLSISVPRCLEETSDRDSVVNESKFAKTEFQSHSDAQDTKDEHSCAQDLTADNGGIDACAVYDDHKMDSSTSDIYLGFDPDAGKEALLQAGSPVFDLAALLADSQQVDTAAETIGWHFPTGVGLSQMSYCPYVQFPDFSYYPALQDNDRIEGGILRFTLQKYTHFQTEV